MCRITALTSSRFAGTRPVVWTALFTSPGQDTIQGRAQAFAAPDTQWKQGEEVTFTFMPKGMHTINAGFRGKTINLTVQVDKATTNAVQASLDKQRTLKPKQKPYGCVEHREQEASVIAHGFRWSDDEGVLIAAEPTALGERNVNGKIHWSWSPSFFTDADYSKAKEMGGVWTFPDGVRGSKGNPARVTGVAFCVGTLTNNPAFHEMPPVKASEGQTDEQVTAAGTSEGVRKGWEKRKQHAGNLTESAIIAGNKSLQSRSISVKLHGDAAKEHQKASESHREIADETNDPQEAGHHLQKADWHELMAHRHGLVNKESVNEGSGTIAHDNMAKHYKGDLYREKAKATDQPDADAVTAQIKGVAPTTDAILARLSEKASATTTVLATLRKRQLGIEDKVTATEDTAKRSEAAKKGWEHRLGGHLTDAMDYHREAFHSSNHHDAGKAAANAHVAAIEAGKIAHKEGSTSSHGYAADAHNEASGAHTKAMHLAAVEGKHVERRYHAAMARYHTEEEIHHDAQSRRSPTSKLSDEEYEKSNGQDRRSDKGAVPTKATSTEATDAVTAGAPAAKATQKPTSDEILSRIHAGEK